MKRDVKLAILCLSFSGILFTLTYFNTNEIWEDQKGLLMTQSHLVSDLPRLLIGDLQGTMEKNEDDSWGIRWDLSLKESIEYNDSTQRLNLE